MSANAGRMPAAEAGVTTAPVISPLTAALSPEMGELVQRYRASGAAPYAVAGAEQSREMYRRATERGAWESGHSVAESDHPLGTGRVRLYRPAGAAPGLIVYFHGGGFLMGDLETHDSVCRELATAAALAVVAVDYPLAPEHPFPAAPDFAIAALPLIVAAATEWEVDASRIALAGDSAGACLAAIVSVNAGDGAPPVLAQCLFYPPTDLHCDSASFREIAAGYPVTGVDGVWFTAQYLGETGDADDPKASPLFTPSLAASPPTFLLTVGHDPLRDEGIAFGARLQQDGVELVHRHLPGHIHGFLTSGAVVPEARTALREAAAHIQAAFARPEKEIRS